jgi:NAD(P)-dependent dehydrogenase (short-subunit alcohol dehydrogenase family)
VSDEFDLRGRVALVTGAGQGVGSHLAQALARRGARVAVNDIDADRARATARWIEDAGGTAVAAVADVTDYRQVSTAVAAVERHLGPVAILVNNAGIPPSGLALRPFAETARADWEPCIEVSLYGVLHCTRAVIGSMTGRGWGRVVTIVSDAGRVGEANVAVYSAAKAAAAGFSRSLAKEVGRSGVTCNCVSLGWMPSPSADVAPEAAQRILRGYAIRRAGVPDDVTGAVIWLASDAAGWVTAQTVSVSGGYATS